MSRYKNCIERAHSIMHKDETWRNVSIEEGIDFYKPEIKILPSTKFGFFAIITTFCKFRTKTIDFSP
jgi:hypothetical protein